MNVLSIIKIRNLGTLLVLIFLSQVSACGGGGSSGGSSVAETGLSEAVTDPPVVEPDPPVIEPDPPVIEPDPPVVEPDPPVTITGFGIIGDEEWDDTAVRKVLHTFAYGGHAQDSQIAAWADMKPEAAIVEMLTFLPTNQKLSPSEDASSLHAGSIEELQRFWSGDDVDNPMRWDKRNLYTTLSDPVSGSFSVSNLQRTWMQAVNTRGINPFLHKVVYYLAYYQMAITVYGSRPGLLRAYYDQFITDLAAGKSFTEVISNAAKSAAVARRYGHRENSFNIVTQQFYGNDDFAREYFQLFFRLQGESEDPEYHERVTIDNNARLLTGMGIDKVNGAYGSIIESDWWVAPIRFTDHVDGLGRVLNNVSAHHANCLEILHHQICGGTAAEKIDMLSPIVARHQEVMDNLPVFVIGSLADDRLSPEKVLKIREAWVAANDDLLSLLRAYAVSNIFHSADRVKFNTAFQRNLTLHNMVVLDNEESFVGRNDADLPGLDMYNQGADIFFPEHDVFGGQTGPEAMLNLNIFRNAYEVASEYVGSRLSRLSSTSYADESLATEVVWNKNWADIIPFNSNSEYLVGEVADWLWQRLIADGGKNFDIIARSQVLALLSGGVDFGYLVTQLNPEISTDPNNTYASADLLGDTRLASIVNSLAADIIEIDSADPVIRMEANQRINLAVNFISALPYTFAMEGN